MLQSNYDFARFCPSACHVTLIASCCPTSAPATRGFLKACHDNVATTHCCYPLTCLPTCLPTLHNMIPLRCLPSPTAAANLNPWQPRRRALHQPLPLATGPHRTNQRLHSHRTPTPALRPQLSCCTLSLPLSLPLSHAHPCAVPSCLASPPPANLPTAIALQQALASSAAHPNPTYPGQRVAKSLPPLLFGYVEALCSQLRHVALQKAVHVGEQLLVRLQRIAVVAQAGPHGGEPGAGAWVCTW